MESLNNQHGIERCTAIHVIDIVRTFQTLEISHLRPIWPSKLADGKVRSTVEMIVDLISFNLIRVKACIRYRSMQQCTGNMALPGYTDVQVCI